MNGKPSRRRKAPSSMSGRLEKALTLIPSGRKPQSTRKRIQNKVRRRRKRRLCTYREPTDRRSLISTSPLLTKTLAVVAAEDVEEDAAVDAVGKVESSVSVATGPMENSVSAAIDPRESTASAVNAPKVIVHQDRKVMLLPVMEEIVAAVAVEKVADVEEIVAAVAVEKVADVEEIVVVV